MTTTNPEELAELPPPRGGCVSDEPDPFYAALMRPGVDGADALALILAQRPAWHRHAACRGMGPERFFPERGDDQRPAKAVCAVCPVTVQCELAARSRGDVGIWGGTSTGSRRRRPRAA